MLAGDKYTSAESVRTVLCERYNLEVVEIREMESYCNKNYFVKAREIDGLKCKNVNYLVVKIVDTTTDGCFDNVGLQHALVRHLLKNNMKCSNPVPTINGETYIKQNEQDQNGKYIFQVLTFLPGQTVNSINVEPDVLYEMFYEVGRNLGKLHQISKTLKYDLTTTTPDSPYLIHNMMYFMDKTSYVEDVTMRKLVEKYLKSYEKNFLQNLETFRKGFIHGDFNDANILFTKSSGAPSTGNKKWQFSGILDFEHTQYGCLVGDIGISMMYSMTKSVSSTGCDVIKSTGELLRGYQSVIEMTSSEKDVVLDVARARMSVSYVSACYQSHVCPENKSYIFLQAQHVPKAFDVLERAGRKALLQAWFIDNAIKL